MRLTISMALSLASLSTGVVAQTSDAGGSVTLNVPRCNRRNLAEAAEFEFERNAYWWAPAEMHTVQPTPKFVISRMGFRLLSSTW